MPNFAGIEEKMIDDWKALIQKWQEISDYWHDDTQQYFERSVWSTYIVIVPATLKEVNTLFTEIVRARREIP